MGYSSKIHQFIQALFVLSTVACSSNESTKQKQQIDTHRSFPFIIFYYVIISIAALVLIYFSIKLYSAKSITPKKQKNLTLDKPNHKFKAFVNKKKANCFVCKKGICNNLFIGNKAEECAICGLILHDKCQTNNELKIIECKYIALDEELHNSSGHQIHPATEKIYEECIVCKKNLENANSFCIVKCLICSQFFHKECESKCQTECSPQLYKTLIIKPSEVIISDYYDPESSNEGDSLVKKPHNLYSMLNKKKVLVNFKIPDTSNLRKPTIFIINKTAGFTFGKRTLEQFYKWFNPIQVIDLIDEGLDVLDLFLDIENLQVVIGGGDGTIHSILNYIFERKSTDCKIRIVPLPIGTSNDLSREFGWGDFVKTDHDLQNFMAKLDCNESIAYLDRWKMSIESFEKDLDIGNVTKVVDYMYTNSGIGSVGKLVNKYESYRKKYPQILSSRLRGFFMILILLPSILCEKKSKFFKNLKIFANKLSDPLQFNESEGFFIVNTLCWAKKANIWGIESTVDSENITKQINEKSIYSNKNNTSNFVKQNSSDKQLEIMGYKNFKHAKKILKKIEAPDRIGQASSYKFEGKNEDNSQFVAFDGEPIEIKGGAYRILITHASQVVFGTCNKDLLKK